MLIRERTEQTERNILSPRAAFADEAERGRKETEDPIRTAFQRDRDRILHSNSFRRLKHKTQVYIAIWHDFQDTICFNDVREVVCRLVGSVRVYRRLV